MCRWLAYCGNEMRPETLLYDAKYSLVEQSRQGRLAGNLPNADGFGLGWYGDREVPGLYRSVAPAWGDKNLRELAGQIRSPLFLAHVRAATGTLQMTVGVSDGERVYAARYASGPVVNSCS